MAEMKQLILVVEGTAALGPHWLNIVSDYLEKVIRVFCANNDKKNPASRIAELNLVIFNARGPSSWMANNDVVFVLDIDWLVQRSEWTKDVDMFMNWLRAIQFSGDASGGAAIAEGLGEALMMFPDVLGSHYHQNKPLQKHCILVAANNPHPGSTPVYKPAFYRTPYCIGRPQSGRHLSVAFTVAKSFPECLVSLSVISPTKLPKLEALYKAAKRKPSAPIDINVENPNYFVLISGCFDEARAALTSPPDITHLPSNPSPKNTGIDLNKSATEAGTSMVNDNVATNVGPSQQTSIALHPSNIPDLPLPDWEGTLYREIQGRREFITRLIAYKMGPSDSVVKDLPSTLIAIDRLVEDSIDDTENVDFLMFKAQDKHPLLVQLQENMQQLFALINLPSHKLLLGATMKEGRLSGMLVPEETVLMEQPQQGQHASLGEQS